MVSCKICGETFRSESKLKRHSAVHSVSCKICGQTFTTATNLKRHSAIHDMSKSFPCNQCKFVSSRKDNLKRHCDLYHKQLYDDSSPKIESNDVLASNGHFVQQPDELIVGNAISITDNHFNSNSFDQRLQLPNNFIYAGATQSGKTTLLMKTLENANKIYNPVPSRVFFLYSCFQNNYAKLQQQLAWQGIECVFHKAATITEHELEEIADPNGGQTLIVIDDNSIAAASSKEMAQVFTIARHKNCSVILLLHFIFGPWPSSRIISANTSYFFLLKSPRMLKQISTLGAQLQKQNALLSAYDQETRKSYGYILLDLCTATPEHMRLRTNIFDGNLCSSMDKRAFGPLHAKPNRSRQTELTDENMMQKLVNDTNIESKDDDDDDDDDDNDDDDDDNSGNCSKFVFVPWDVKDRKAYIQKVLGGRGK